MDPINKKHLLFVCRVCLRRTTKIHPLEGVVLNTNVSISTMISYCTSIEVILDEDLPRGVCFPCFRSIQIAYNFITKFKESNRRLLAERETSKDKSQLPNQGELNTRHVLELKKEPIYSLNFKEFPSYSQCFIIEKSPDESNEELLGVSKINENKYSVQEENKIESEISIKQEPVEDVPLNSCEVQIVSESAFDSTYSPEQIFIKCDNDSDDDNTSYNNHSAVNAIQSNPNKLLGRYSCPICFKMFADFKRGLIRHLRCYHKNHKFKCDKCSLETQLTVDLYVQHYNKTHLYRCPYCNRKCGSKGGFWYHKKKCFDPEKNSLDAGEGPSNIAQNKLLTRHVCPVCSKGFVSFNRGLIKHLRHCHQNKDFKCSKCSSEIVLTVDLFVQHYNEEHLYQCPTCDRKLDSKGGFYYHIKKCVGPEKVFISCINDADNPTAVNGIESNGDKNVCEKNKNLLLKVEGMPSKKILSQNKLLTTYVCPICAKVFSDFNNRIVLRHLRYYHSNELFKCDRCTMADLSLDLYVQHYKTHLYHCPICDKKLGTRTTFFTHTKSHIKGTSSQCPHQNCKKSFPSSLSLRKHLDTHSTTANYICSKCGKKFNTYDTFRYHNKTHDGKRNYLCSVCGRSFIQSVHLKYHMWQHTGVKQFRCNDCGKSYTSVTHLKKHRRKYCGAVNTSD